MSSLDQQRIERLIDTYRDALLNNVVPFWRQYAVDREYGGLMTCLNRDGAVIDTDKSVWQQGRSAWLFGRLYNTVEQRSDWLEQARHAVKFIDQFCFDPADGRMYFQVTRDGRPIRKRRYAFSEGFAALAYGELARAEDDQHCAVKARRCFQRFIDHGQNPQGVAPKFTDVRPVRGIAVPMIMINVAQELRRSIGLPDADGRIDDAIELIRRYHVREDISCVLETAGPNGEIVDHFDGRTLNPGHAMEAAWFIMREGRHRNDPNLIQLGSRMLDWMWHRGWDEEYGGLLYFVDVKGLPVQEYWHDMKFWWPHNEAIIATLLAWTLTGDSKYAQWHEWVQDWAFRHFSDPDRGEWFGYLHRDGRLSVPLKGNLWKGPFHLPRMLLTCWQILSSCSRGRPGAPDGSN